MGKYEMKLYTTFDADLISLNAAGISVPKLIRIALERRVRGERARFFVNGCLKYDLTGRKRKIHTSVTIKDRMSIEFLEREIKPRMRSAFFKAIVREALVNQPIGVYLKNDNMIIKEDIYIKRQDVGDVRNLEIFTPSKKKRKRDYAREILSPSPERQGQEVPDEEDEPKKNRFGSVEDLSFSAQQKKAGKHPPAGRKPAGTVPVPAKDASGTGAFHASSDSGAGRPLEKYPYSETDVDESGGSDAGMDEDAALYNLFVGMDSGN